VRGFTIERGSPKGHDSEGLTTPRYLHRRKRTQRARSADRDREDF
jgi:hypothetical protein